MSDLGIFSKPPEPDPEAIFNPRPREEEKPDPEAIFNPRKAPEPNEELDNIDTGKIPKALIERFSGKPGAAFVEGFREGFGEDPFERDRQRMEDLGWINKPGTPMSWTSGLKFANELVLQHTIADVERLMALPNAVLEGTGAMFGQAIAQYTGAGEAMQAKARKDAANMLAIGALLYGAKDHITRAADQVKLRPRLPEEGAVDRMMELTRQAQTQGNQVIGTVPTVADYTNAAKAILPADLTGPAAKVQGAGVIEKLGRLYTQYGIHPAEVEFDARQDQAVRDSLLSPQKSDLPARYTGGDGELTEEQKIDREVGQPPKAEVPPVPPGVGADVPTTPTRFQTAKGSTYEVHEDGTTTRNKAARTEPGHEGDEGIKPRSQKTVYVPPEDVGRFAAPVDEPWRVIEHEDGTLSLVTRNPQTGVWGIAPSSRNITVTDTPAVGLVPIELWGKETGSSGFDAYSKIHPGNEIVKVEPEPRPAVPPAGDLYQQAVQIVTQDRRASTSYIQRRLGLGYVEASALIDRMEKEGIVGPPDNFGKRDVLGPPAAPEPIAAERPPAAPEEELPPAIEVKPKKKTGRNALPDEQLSVLEFLSRKGGLKPDPELTKILGGKHFVPGFGNLFRKTGMTISEAMEKAVAAGYIIDPAERTGGESKLVPQDLLNLIDEEGNRKRKQWRLGREGAAEAERVREAKIDPEQVEHEANQYLDHELEKIGEKPERLSEEQRARIIDMVKKGSHPLDAWETLLAEDAHEAVKKGEVGGDVSENIPGWEAEQPPEPGRAAEPDERPAGGAGRGGAEVGGPVRVAGEGDREPPRPDTLLNEDDEEYLATHGLGAQATNQVNPIGVGGRGQPRAKPYYTYEDKNWFRQTFESSVRGWKETFQAHLISDLALMADPLFGMYKAATARLKDGIMYRAEKMRQYWRSRTPTERLDYMDRVERRAIMPANWRIFAERHRTMLNRADEMEHQHGSKAGYIQEYFPHLFLDPDKVRGFINSRVAQIGPKWFQKDRTFDFIAEALEAGLRLKSDNPEDLVTYRLFSSADMVERMKLLEELHKYGAARVYAALQTGEARLLERQGWQAIDAPNMERWLIHPDVQPLWKNAVDAKGFWANEGKIGSTFRGWMAFKAAWVPIKLTLSLFHPLHVIGIHYASALDLAWSQLTKGADPTGAMSTLLHATYAPVMAIPGMGPFEAKFAREWWKKDPEQLSPVEKAAVDLMIEGTFVPEVSEQLRANSKLSLEAAWDKENVAAKVPLLAIHGTRWAIEQLQKPIFQEWIPNLKTMSYLNRAKALLERRPELLDDPIQRRVALRQIAQSVDNRFGEMFYGGLFWNRYVKDAAIGGFLSLGWNLGFAREFGGAAFDPFFRAIDRTLNGETVTQATMRDAQSKLPFVLSYVGVSMLINGLMSWYLSGEPPEGLDWFFARVGGTNADGSPRRITNMSYLREIPMLEKHVQEQQSLFWGAGEMLWNKMMIQPMKEMFQNRDYYGNDIWDENGPVYMKALQGARHMLGEQFMPMSITGAKRAYLTSGNWYEAELAMMGFGPAPSYVERNATQNRINYFFDRYVTPYSRPQEIGEKSKTRADIRNELLIAQKNGDHEALRDAANRWMDAGGSRQGLSNILLHVPGDIIKFRALPEPAQRAVMQGATPEDQAKYRPYLKSNAAAEAAGLLMQAEHQQAAGDIAGAAESRRQFAKVVKDAVSNGQITDRGSFGRSLAQQMIARHAPEVAAILAVPRKLRPQYLKPGEK